MDEFSPFYYLQDDDDFLFQNTFPTLSLQQQDVEQDLVIPGASHAPVLEPNEPAPDKKGKKQRKSTAVQEDGSGSGADNKQKRIIHRDTERQRRQGMADLYASLRTLLPLEYIKGKRSICDQVNEAVNYIKYKENNIKQLQSKRDKLRNLLDGNDANAKVGTSGGSSPIEISVRQCSHGGIEILITNEVGEEQCTLSSLLEALVEEGLTVVSCGCTKVNDKFLHIIQTEASHNARIDIRDLPQKLSLRIKAPVNFKCFSNT